MAQSPNIIRVSTPNIYSINKVFVQKVLEVIGQTTKCNIDKNPQEMLKIEPIILEFYRQITRYLFNLEADEKRHTGVITIHPELRQVVTDTWSAVWNSFEKLHKN